MRRFIYKGLSLLGKAEVTRLTRESLDPLAAQTRRIQAIVEANKATDFGRKHSFQSIRSASDFQKAVPITDYEGLKPYLDNIALGKRAVLTAEDPLMFATTSGTTGAQKLIPITRSYMNEFRRASIVSGYNLLRDYPSLSEGVAITIFSPAEEGRSQGGIPYGAISGRLFLEEPSIVKRFISPLPYEICLIKDYESRYYALLRLALDLPVTSLMTLNPSTLVLLSRRLKDYGANLIGDIATGTINPPRALPENVQKALAKFCSKNVARAQELDNLLKRNQFVPHKIWPMLKVVCCWTKASAAFYLMDFPEYFGDLPISDVTYGASEGRGSVYMGSNKQMLAIRSHFYEFVPESEINSPDRCALLANELEVGANYHILFTTSGGLYRYHLNDVVKVVGFYNKTPLIEFQYKGGNVSSFTGEKLTELQVTQAMAATLDELSVKTRFFTLVPEFRPEPHYELYFEPDCQSDLRDVIQTFDRQLGLFNSEYLVKRESARLAPAEFKLLKKGTYENLRKKLVASGVPDSQVKISHLNPKDEIKDVLKASITSPLHR